MKLTVVIFSLLKLTEATLPGYESYCIQNTLTIKIPYDNPKTADLLEFKAGSCTGSGESSLVHSYAYNFTAQMATFEVEIDECGLNSNSDSEGAFSAVANITLGVSSNGQNLVFYNALLGAQCGETTDYTVSFTYSNNIDISGDVECETDEDGNCVIPAYNQYSFDIVEFTDSGFSSPATAETRQTIANQPIYLKLSSDDLPAHKKFAVKKCTVNDGGDGNYVIFNPEEGVCQNEFIDLSFSYDNVYINGIQNTEVRIIHNLFLLGNGNTESSYNLNCEIKVCDRNNGTSECNDWVGCLDDANAIEDYICDSEMQNSCPDDENCVVQDSSEGHCEALVQEEPVVNRLLVNQPKLEPEISFEPSPTNKPELNARLVFSGNVRKPDFSPTETVSVFYQKNENQIQEYIQEKVSSPEDYEAMKSDAKSPDSEFSLHGKEYRTADVASVTLAHLNYENFNQESTFEFHLKSFNSYHVARYFSEINLVTDQFQFKCLLNMANGKKQQQICVDDNFCRIIKQENQIPSLLSAMGNCGKGENCGPWICSSYY